MESNKNKQLTYRPVKDKRCKQCNRILNTFEYLTSKDNWYICNKCVKRNHGEVAKK